MEYGTGIDNDTSVDPQESSKIELRPQVASRQKGKPGNTPPGSQRFRLNIKKKSQRLSQKIAGITEGIKEEIKEVSQNLSPRPTERGGGSPRQNPSNEQERPRPASRRRSSANQVYSNKPYPIRSQGFFSPGNRNSNGSEKSGMPLARYYSNQDKPARRYSEQAQLASQIQPTDTRRVNQVHFPSGRSGEKRMPNNISIKFKELVGKVETSRKTVVWDIKSEGSFASKIYNYSELSNPFHSRETLFNFLIFKKQQLVMPIKHELINLIKILFDDFMDPVYRQTNRYVNLANHNQVRSFFMEMIETLTTIHPLVNEKTGEEIADLQLQSLKSLVNNAHVTKIPNCLKKFKKELQKIELKIQPIIDNIKQILILLASIEYHFNLYKNGLEVKIDQRSHLEKVESFHTIMEPVLKKLCPNLEEKFSFQFDNQSVFNDLFSLYEIIKSNPNLIVSELYFLSKLPQNLSPYVNNYILLNNKETMYYIEAKKRYYLINADTTGEKIEIVAQRVEINDFNKIPKNHKKISLSVNTLDKFIISNGGHNAINEIFNNPFLIKYCERLIANYFKNTEDKKLLPNDFKHEKYNNLYLHKIVDVKGWLEDLFIIKEIFKIQNIKCSRKNHLGKVNALNIDEMKILAGILTKLSNMKTITKDEIIILDNLLAGKVSSDKVLPKSAENKEVKALLDILSNSDEIKLPELLPLILKIYTESYIKHQEALTMEQPAYINLCP